MKEIFDEIQSANKLSIERMPIKVMLTGVMCVGKSTLLNALIGKKENKTQNDSSDIYVETFFRTVSNKSERICFIDTPGVNSYRNMDHKKLTEETIINTQPDLLIYVLDGTRIASYDIYEHLLFVFENYHGKIVFVVNKLDQEEDSVSEILEKAILLLREIGFENPLVLPISAYAAYLAKMNIFNVSLNEDENYALDRIARKMKKAEYQFDTYFPEYAREGIYIMDADKNQQVLMHSGILQLENIIYTIRRQGMREIFIKYNPYRLETIILIDGETPKQNSRLNFTDCRLQEWIEELPDILFEECSSRNFKLTFHGTILDYEDVEAMAREAKNDGIIFELEHIAAKEVSDKEAAISEIFDEIQAGPFEELKQPDVIKAFNMAKSSDFEVNVVATMSAGKSTLINALLRQKLMPAKQEACTATITEIRDNDSDYFMAKVYDTDGHLIQTHPELTFEIMDSLNNNPEVFRIRAEGNIPFVSAEDVALVLVDTPGPNNSRDPEHKAATYRMLSESSKTVVLYIINATQLAVNDDYNLLSHVADSMRVGGKQSKDRFIFVVNKLDDFKKGEDSVESAITKVRDYLKDNGIENANIYPASALTALNIRTILAESDDDDDDEVYEAKGKVRKFNRNPEMHFETLAPLTPSIRGQIENRLAEARNNKDTYEEALIHCGIIPIEMAIQMYVQKYAKTAKIKNIVDTFSKRLESAKSFELTKQEITENQDKQKEILANIEVIKKKLASGEDAKRFRKRIEQINYDNEIKKLANQIIMEAQKKITAQLSSTDTKISRREAEELCKQFAHFADNLQAEVQVKLEQLITNHVHKNASELLEEYKKKISELAQDISVGNVLIDPFELMAGDISTDVSSLIKKLTEKERVKVDEVWVENTNKKWYKPWTWFQEKGHWKDVYEDKEYIDGTKLSQRFFAPIQEQLYENNNNAIEYAKAQTQKIKQEFSKKFAELDAVLKQKLKELENCANDNKDIERRIRESQAKLKWLEDIQIKTKSILDI